MNQTNSNSTHKKVLPLLLVMLCFGLLTYGQREPLYTQYMYNIGSFNPAYGASVETLDISGLYRAQWIDIPGAPRNIRLGINYPFENERMGMGFNVVSDQLGPATDTYVDVAYSYQIQVGDATQLSFGVDAGVSFLNVDFSKGTFENPGEPILDREQINEIYPTVGAGLFLYQDRWYLGASVPNFLTDELYNQDVATIVEDKIQLNFIGGYVFDLSENLKFKPAFLLNYISAAPATFNLSANFLIKDIVTAGASYRTDSAVSALVGFQVSNGAFIGYAYDYNTNGLGEFNSGSHELILKFYIGRGDASARTDKAKTPKGKPKQIDSPRFF